MYNELSANNKLTGAEKVGISALDDAAAQQSSEGDQNERAVGVFKNDDGTYTGSSAINGNSEEVKIGSLLTDKSVVIVGHTHTNGNEIFSSKDRNNFGILTNPNRTQFLLRTNTGAIRSLRNPGDGVIRETLRGESVYGYPLRE